MYKKRKTVACHTTCVRVLLYVYSIYMFYVFYVNHNEGVLSTKSTYQMPGMNTEQI